MTKPAVLPDALISEFTTTVFEDKPPRVRTEFEDQVMSEFTITFPARVRLPAAKSVARSEALTLTFDVLCSKPPLTV